MVPDGRMTRASYGQNKNKKKEWPTLKQLHQLSPLTRPNRIGPRTRPTSSGGTTAPLCLMTTRPCSASLRATPRTASIHPRQASLPAAQAARATSLGQAVEAGDRDERRASASRAAGDGGGGRASPDPLLE